MQRSLEAYLWDIEQEANNIQTALKEKTLARYTNDWMLHRAVERSFEIIGEALVQASRNWPQVKDKIETPARIVSFRNQLIHGYPNVDDAVVWDIAHKYLPMLRSQVREWLRELGSGSPPAIGWCHSFCKQHRRQLNLQFSRRISYACRRPA